MVRFCVLPRTNLAYCLRHSGLNPRRFILLQTLCRCDKSQLLWNQANPHSFRKTPGVGYTPQIAPMESTRCRLFFRTLFANQLPHPSAPPPPRVSISLSTFAFRISIFVCRFFRPFVFTTLRIAFSATSLFSQPSELPGGVTPNPSLQGVPS